MHVVYECFDPSPFRCCTMSESGIWIHIHLVFESKNKYEIECEISIIHSHSIRFHPYLAPPLSSNLAKSRDKRLQRAKFFINESDTKRSISHYVYSWRLVSRNFDITHIAYCFNMSQTYIWSWQNDFGYPLQRIVFKF